MPYSGQLCISANLHPKVYTVPSHIVNGHEILKMKLNVRPTVVSNPLHPEHLTIPCGVFIPGKDGTRSNQLLLFKIGTLPQGIKTTTSLKAVLLARLVKQALLVECLQMADKSVLDTLALPHDRWLFLDLVANPSNS